MKCKATFNRTILELKPQETKRLKRKNDAFNRTILELKHEIQKWVKGERVPFNRTILELKQSGKVHLLHIENAFNRLMIESIVQLIEHDPVDEASVIGSKMAATLYGQ